MWTLLFADTLATGGIQHKRIRARSNAGAFAARLIKNEMWRAFLMPETLADALAFVFIVLTMRTVWPVWAHTLTCVVIRDSWLLADWTMWADAFALRLVKDLVWWAVCYCMWALTFAGVRVECLSRSASCVFAHALACIRIENLVLCATFGMVWADTFAADRVDDSRRSTVGLSWAFALASFGVEDVTVEGTLLGDVGADTLACFWVYPLSLSAVHGLVGTDTGAGLVVKTLCI